MTFVGELEQQFEALCRKRCLSDQEWRYVETLAFFIRRLQVNSGPTSEEQLKALGYGVRPAERVPVHVMSVPGVPPGVPESADL